jgi:hypothetical protein
MLLLGKWVRGIEWVGCAERGVWSLSYWCTMSGWVGCWGVEGGIDEGRGFRCVGGRLGRRTRGELGLETFEKVWYCIDAGSSEG